MLLMADFNAMEWRSPAVPATVCDFGGEVLGIVETEEEKRDGEDVLCCADAWAACGAGGVGGGGGGGAGDMDGSAVWARAWDVGTCDGCVCRSCCFGAALFSLSR